MKHKYKIGDKVTIRSDLILHKQYGSDIFVEGMVPFKGKEVQIKDLISKDKIFHIKEVWYNFTFEMIQQDNPVNIF